MNAIDNKYYKKMSAKKYLNQKDNKEMKKIYDKFHAYKLLKLYYKNKLDRKIESFYYGFKEKYKNQYNTLQGIDYSSDNVQDYITSDTTATRATKIVDLRFTYYLRYIYLLKAKKAIKRLLEGLNRQQQRELKFYFEYPDELEEKCVELAKSFKKGREDYKKIKKLVRKCCNELDRMLL